MIKAARNQSREWLFAHVQHQGEDCLIWPFYRDPYYGRGRLGALEHEYGKGKIVWAHRLMCELTHGPAPSDKHQAAHNCGNGSGGCVNPKHLEWKTNSQNQRDRRKHGTQAGAKGTRTHFTPQQIEQVRRLKGRVPQLALAELLGCKRGTIEYWQRTTHTPLAPGTSESSVRRRQSRKQQS